MIMREKMIMQYKYQVLILIKQKNPPPLKGIFFKFNDNF